MKSKSSKPKTTSKSRNIRKIADSDQIEMVTPAAIQDIEPTVRKLLSQLGENPDRNGLQETPRRVAKALIYLTQGYHQDIDTLLNDALFPIQYDEMVIVKDIDFYSLCEHHLLPFFGKCHVGYIPRKHVVGLSKVPRHLCMSMRGVEKQNTVAVTSEMLGVFRKQQQTRDEFLKLIRQRGVDAD
jgi:GTP cyclohydrolase I